MNSKTGNIGICVQGYKVLTLVSMMFAVLSLPVSIEALLLKISILSYFVFESATVREDSPESMLKDGDVLTNRQKKQNLEPMKSAEKCRFFAGSWNVNDGRNPYGIRA